MANNKKQARPIFTTFSDISQPDLNGQVVGANEVSTNNIVTGQQPSVYKFTINGQDFDIASKDLNRYKTEIMNHIQNQSGVSNLGLSKLGKHVDDLFSALTQNTGDGRLNITLDPTGQIFTINGTDYGRVSNMERNYFGGLSARDLIGNFNKNFSSRLQGISPTGRTVTKTTSSFTPAALQKPASTTADEEGRFELLNSIAKRMNRDSWNDEVSKGWFGLSDAAKKGIIEDVLENDFKKHSSYANWLKRNPNTSLTFTDFLNSKSVLQSIEPIDYIKLYEQIAPTTDTNKAYTDFLIKEGLVDDNKRPLGITYSDNYLKQLGIDAYIDHKNGSITALKQNADGSIRYYTLADRPDSNTQRSLPFNLFYGNLNNPNNGMLLFPSINPNKFVFARDASGLTGNDASTFRTYETKLKNAEYNFDGVEGNDDPLGPWKGITLPSEGYILPWYLDKEENRTNFTDITPYIDPNRIKDQKLFLYNVPQHLGGYTGAQTAAALYDTSDPKHQKFYKGWVTYNPKDGYVFRGQDKLVSFGAASDTPISNYTQNYYPLNWWNLEGIDKFPEMQEIDLDRAMANLKKVLKENRSENKITRALAEIKLLVKNKVLNRDNYLKYKGVLDLANAYIASLSEKQNSSQQPVISQKLGGILKMQYGGLAEAYKNQITPDSYKDVKLNYDASKSKERAFFSTDPLASTSDKIRTYTLAADAASLAGGGLGLASSAASLVGNTVADIMDVTSGKMKTEDAWKNLIVNVAFTALAAVPGLAALKVTKGASKATTSAIKVLGKADEALRASKFESLGGKGIKEASEKALANLDEAKKIHQSKADQLVKAKAEVAAAKSNKQRKLANNRYSQAEAEEIVAKRNLDKAEEAVKQANINLENIEKQVGEASKSFTDAAEKLKKSVTVKEAKDTAASLIELNNSTGGKLFGNKTQEYINALEAIIKAEDSVKRSTIVGRTLGWGLSGYGATQGLGSGVELASGLYHGDLSNFSEQDARNIIGGIAGYRGMRHLWKNRSAFNNLRSQNITETKTVQGRKNKITFKDAEKVSIEVEGKPTAEKVKSAINAEIAQIDETLRTATTEEATSLKNRKEELIKARDSFTETSFSDKVKFGNISEKVNAALDKGEGFWNKIKGFGSGTLDHEINLQNTKINELETSSPWLGWKLTPWRASNIDYKSYFKQGGKVKKYEQGDATTSGINPEEQVKKEKGSSRTTIGEKTLTDVLLENLEDQELIGFGNPRKLAFDIEPIGSIISHGIAALGNKKALKTLMDYEVPYVQAPEISLPVKVNTALENASKERARQLLNPHFHNLTSDASRNQAAYLDTQRQISENTRQVDAQIAQDLNQQRDKAVAQEYVNRKAQTEVDNTDRAHAVAKANAKNQILAAYQKQQADNAEQLNRDIFSWAGRRINQLNEANYLKRLHELAQKYQNPISDATAWANSAEVYESSNVAQSLATAGIDGDTPITADIIPENAKEQAVYPGGPKWKDVVGLTGKQLWLAEKNVAQRNLRNLMGQYSTDKVSLTADKTRYEHMIGLPLYQKQGGSMTAQAQIYNTDRRMELAYKKLMADQEKYYNWLAYKKNRNSMAGLLRAFLQEDKHAFKK